MDSRLEWMRSNDAELMATLRDIEVFKIQRRHGGRARHEAGSRPLKRTIIESLGVVAITHASVPESEEALTSPLNICRNGDYYALRTVYNESVAKLMSVETGAPDDPAGMLEGAVSSPRRQCRPSAGPKDLGEGPARCFKPVRKPRHTVATNGGSIEPSECEADRLSTCTTVRSTSPPTQALRCMCDHSKSAMALLILFALPALWCFILGFPSNSAILAERTPSRATCTFLRPLPGLQRSCHWYPWMSHQA